MTMWFAAEIFAAIEARDNSRLWRLISSLAEQDAVLACTSLGPDRLRGLLYQFVRQSKVNAPHLALVTVGQVDSASSRATRTNADVLVPVVLSQAFKDRSFLGSQVDAAASSRVERHLSAWHAARAARPLVNLFRDVTHTIDGPSVCHAPLSEAEYAESAKRLGVEVAAIKAVAEVESRGDAFDAKNRPKIMFEGHWFQKFTKGRYDLTHPHLSFAYDRAVVKKYQKWDQYNRLYEAIVLDPSAAVQSSSWGKFQVMGFNYQECGAPDPISFVRSLHGSESNQLKAFEAFCAKKGLIAKLKKLDWAGFADTYNGSDNKVNRYDTKMAAAYKKHGGK
jgi:hypothetical protein